MNKTDIKSAKFETRKLGELTNWENNPRSILKEDFERLKGQILKLGNYKTLLVNQDNIVLGGNMRLRAFTEMFGAEHEIMCGIVETKDPGEMLEYALSDNDNAGTTDDLKLAEVFALSPIDTQLYKIQSNVLRPLQSVLDAFGPEVTEDEAPPVADVAVSKLGEIYQLGRHRLMCGDSTDFGTVSDLMDGTVADMVFTDPPYGVNYEGGTKDKLTIQNDDTTDTFTKTIDNFITKPGAAYYVCCPPGSNFMDFATAFVTKCKISSTIIWVKNSMVLGHGDYHYQHEPILYGWDKEGTHKFYGSRNQTTIWGIDRPSKSKEHPTMKPLALVGKAIKNSSKSGAIVLDLFGGSGSTLIACEQLDRTCYMMELDPKYCDVIRKRYAKFANNNELPENWAELTLVT